MELKLSLKYCRTAFVFVLFSILAVAASGAVYPGSDWVDAAPTAMGIDEKKLQSALAKINGGTRTVIIRDGRRVYKGNGFDTQKTVYSVSKSVSTMLLGALIDEGRCSIGDPAWKYDGALKEKYSAVTLHHLASFTSGYDCVSKDPTKAPWIPGAPQFAPGTKFNYYDPAFTEAGVILTLIAGKDIKALFNEKLAGPLGIAGWDWSGGGRLSYKNLTIWQAGGYHGGLMINANHLARLGHLMLNQGAWNGKQILSKSWVNASTSVQVAVNLQDISGGGYNGAYGYQWALNPLQGTKSYWPNAPRGTYGKSGFAGSYLFVIPAWNMVIARTEAPIPNHFKGWDAFFAEIKSGITETSPTTELVIAKGETRPRPAQYLPVRIDGTSIRNPGRFTGVAAAYGAGGSLFGILKTNRISDR